MALVLLKLFLKALSFVTSLASTMLFKGIAIHVVLLIQTLKLPGMVIDYGLESIRTLINMGLEYLLQGIGSGLVMTVTYVYELVCSTGLASSTFTASAIDELIDRMKPVVYGLMQSILEVFEEVMASVGKMILDSVCNLMQAVRYIIENA